MLTVLLLLLLSSSTPTVKTGMRGAPVAAPTLRGGIRAKGGEGLDLFYWYVREERWLSSHPRRERPVGPLALWSRLGLAASVTLRRGNRGSGGRGCWGREGSSDPRSRRSKSRARFPGGDRGGPRSGTVGRLHCAAEDAVSRPTLVTLAAPFSTVAPG